MVHRFLIACALAGFLSTPAAAQMSDAQIREALMANAWCSFRYNQVTGASASSVASFAADVLSIGSEAESHSSGWAGSVAGQSTGTDQYYWGIQNGALLLSEDGIGWESYDLDARHDSGGTLILVVGGHEWAAC